MGIGLLGKYNFSEKFYFKPGVNLQVYLDGSGTSFGLDEAIGINNKVGEKLHIPVELRMDQIFGNALSFIISIGTGINLSF
jgi:hypothetical protein